MRTNTFYHIVDRRHDEAFWQVDARHRNMVKTVGLLALFTIKVDMQIIVNTVVMTMA